MSITNCAWLKTRLRKTCNCIKRRGGVSLSSQALGQTVAREETSRWAGGLDYLQRATKLFAHVSQNGTFAIQVKESNGSLEFGMHIQRSPSLRPAGYWCFAG